MMAKQTKEKKLTVGTVTPAHFLVLSDAVRDDGLGDDSLEGFGPERLCYSRYLKTWQVACLRWVFPSCEAQFSYTNDELAALPKWVRQRVPTSIKQVAFDVRVVEKILGLFGFDLERHSRRLDTVVMASPASCCLPPLRDWHHRHSAPWSNAKFCAGFCGLCLGCSLATMQLVNSGEFNPVVYEKAKKLVRED
jgi:hypothetical protein